MNEYNAETLKGIAKFHNMDIVFGSEGGESGCIMTACRKFTFGRDISESVYFLTKVGDSIKCEWQALYNAKLKNNCFFPTWEDAIEFVNRYDKGEI